MRVPASHPSVLADEAKILSSDQSLLALESLISPPEWHTSRSMKDASAKMYATDAVCGAVRRHTLRPVRHIMHGRKVTALRENPSPVCSI